MLETAKENHILRQCKKEIDCVINTTKIRDDNSQWKTLSSLPTGLAKEAVGLEKAQELNELIANVDRALQAEKLCMLAAEKSFSPCDFLEVMNKATQENTDMLVNFETGDIIDQSGFIQNNLAKFRRFSHCPKPE
jgi:hypothetical protein